VSPLVIKIISQISSRGMERMVTIAIIVIVIAIAMATIIT